MIFIGNEKAGRKYFHTGPQHLVVVVQCRGPREMFWEKYKQKWNKAAKNIPALYKSNIPI